MTKPSSVKQEFTIRNYGILMAVLLLGGVAGSIAAGMQRKTVSQLRTTYYRSGSIVLPRSQVVVQQQSNPNRWQYAMLGTACLGGLAATTLVKVKNGDQLDPLIDLNTLGTDSVDTLQKASIWLHEATGNVAGSGLSSVLTVGKKSAKFMHLKVLPTPIRNAVDDAIMDRTWLNKLLKKHVLVAGKNRQGKTILVKLGIIEYIKHYPNGWLRICDPNYGKRGLNGEEPNTWMDLPLEYISGYDPVTCFDDIFAAIDAEYQDLLERRKANAAYAAAKQQNKPAHVIQKLKAQAECIPSLLVIDEEPDVMAEAKSRGILGDVMKKIQALLTQGLSYNKRLYILAQSTSVDMTEIKLSRMDQMCKCLVGDLAERKTELTAIGADDSNVYRSRVRAFRRKGKRVAVVDLGEGDPRIQIVPDLSWISQVSYRPINSTQEWWILHYVQNENNRQWLEQRAEQYARKQTGASPLSSNNRSELMRRFGGLKPDNRDPRYSQYFKPRWEQLVQEKQTALPVA